MKLPRDISGIELARALVALGYTTTRQTGSHLRLTTQEHGEHHVTIPTHKSMKVGTLSAILSEIAGHFDVDRGEIARRLFGG